MTITLDGTYGVTWPNQTGFASKLLNIQQYSTTNTTYYSGSATPSYQEVTDMSWTYTPVGSGSKVLMMWDLHIGHQSNYSWNLRLMVNGAYPFLGNAGTGYQSTGPSIYVNNTSAMIFNFCGRYIYQNAGTTALSLKLWGSDQSGSFYINRGYSYDDSARHRTVSYWTIMEFA